MDKIRLICLVGIPGSGKTTYASEYISKYGGVHLSSDLIRKELYGDESIQGDPADVFSLMQKRAIEHLNNGDTVIYDATNITRKDRASIIYACPKFVHIEAHVIWSSIETCIERDTSRNRTVGKAVIDKMLKRFQPPFYDEGFDEIKIIIPEDFDANEYYNKYYNAMKIPHDNPNHTYGVHEHCIAALNHSLDKRFNSNVKYAAMIHDIGKPYTKAFIDSKGNPSETAHYYQHQCVGAWIAYGIYPDPYIAWLVGAHMEPFFNSKYYKNLPNFLKKDIDLLHEADLNAH